MSSRFTIDFTSSGTALLEETRIATGRETKEEVIRDALTLWHMLREMAREGQQLYIGADKIKLIIPPLEYAFEAGKEI